MVSELAPLEWDILPDADAERETRSRQIRDPRYGAFRRCALSRPAPTSHYAIHQGAHIHGEIENIAYYFGYFVSATAAASHLRHLAATVRLDPLGWQSSLDSANETDDSLLTLCEAILASHREQQTEELRSTFDELARTWKRETRGSSLAHRIAEHLAYQRIIGMGPAALPLILEDLAADGGHWFIALHAISGARPVPSEDRGRVRRMRDAWLRWGRDEGIIA